MGFFCRRFRRQARPPRVDRPATPAQTTVRMLTLAALLAGSTLPAWSGQGSPAPGMQPLDENRQMRISSGDRCPVCGMPVMNYEKFAGAVQLKDETTYYFCSAGCLIRAWLHPEIFIGAPRGALQTAVVREYFTGRTIDARRVFWVAGSDVIGPMGPALVPLRDKRSVQTFIHRHGGHDTFLLDELDDERWFAITGKKAGR
jgi:copper chaperone NosL